MTHLSKRRLCAGYLLSPELESSSSGRIGYGAARVFRFFKMFSIAGGAFSLVTLALVCVSSVVGCASRQSQRDDLKLHLSGTAYTYQPLNPTTVWVRDPTGDEKKKEGWLDADETSREFYNALLRDLDTETVRIALNTLEGNVDLNAAGVVGTSVKGRSYVLIVDYIKYFASAKQICMDYISSNAQGQEVKKTFEGTIPFYTGIGLRIRAEFRAAESGLDISGLPAIAVAANAKGIDGRLTVQTLGITGPEITGLMPLISDISVTSIQNAVQAVGAIKAKIYEDSTIVYPKIIGFESPEIDPSLNRAITEYLYGSEEYICPVLAKEPQDETRRILSIYWFRPPPEDADTGLKD